MENNPTKKKKPLEFPTFGNDAFLVPSVVCGIIYVYEFIQMIDFEVRLAAPHAHDPILFFNNPYGPTIYTLNIWPIAVPGLICFISMFIYMGAIDVLTLQISRSNRQRLMLYIGKRLVEGVIDTWEWNSGHTAFEKEEQHPKEDDCYE